MDKNQEILAAAIARNAGSVLSIRTGAMIRHFKSRFITETDTGIWLEAPDSSLDLLDSLIEPKELVAVTFKTTELRMSFSTTVMALDRDYPLNQTLTIRAVRVGKAAEIRAFQRRSAYRAPVPEDSDLSLRLWVMPEHAHLSDRPATAQKLDATLRNISVGGLGILVQNKGRTLAGSQRLRVELTAASTPILLEGRLRIGAPVGSAGKLACGIILEKLDTDLEGRRKLAALTNIVGQLQREEVRRAHYRKAS